MGFFHKNKKNGRNKGETSENDSLPNLPEFQINKSPTLPSIANIRGVDQFNKASIKDAVTNGKKTPEMPKLPELPEIPKFDVGPINARESKNPSTTHIEPLHKPRHIETGEWTREPKHNIPDQPLFIKLDIFEKAVSSFNEIKLRVGEIESLLRNIRGVKNKEENELNEWESEIEQIKVRLEQINHDIFDRVD